MRTSSMPAVVVVMALSVSVSGLLAQTLVKLPKNKYTPKQDVELGREAAAEVRKQYPIIKDERIARYLGKLGDRLVAAAPSELKESGLRVLVHAGEPEGDQRVRAPGRADVRPPRHVRRGGFRRRGRRRHGARAVARAASTRNGQRLQGAEPLAAARPDRRRVGGAVVGGARDRPSRRAASSGWARCSCDTAATSRSRRICSARRSWRAPATTRARSRACSRRSSASRRAAADSGPQWMSSHPNPGQPDAVHHQGSRPAADREPRPTTASSSRSRPRSRRCRRPSRWAICSRKQGVRRPAAQAVLRRSARPGNRCRRRRGSIGTSAAARSSRRRFPPNWTTLVLEERDQGRPAERVRSTQRTDRIQPRRRVRRGESRIARSAGSDERLAEGRRAGQSQSSASPVRQQAVRLSQRSAIATPLVNPSPLGGQERIVVYDDASWPMATCSTT